MLAPNTSLNLGHDLLFRNQQTGHNAIWLLNDTTLAIGRSTMPVSDPNWHLVGAGDFNGDSNSDLVWRNQATGQDVIWLMHGTSLASFVSTTAIADLNWQIVGAGDFNHDGNSDLVWRNRTTGQDVIWLTNSTSLASFVSTTALADPKWQIVGTGNFSLFSPTVNYPAGSNPQDISSGDFNGDGKLDLAVVNPSFSTVSVLLSNGNGTFQAAVSSPVGVPFGSIAGNFNGDGKLDLAVVNLHSNAVWKVPLTLPSTTETALE